MQMPLEYSTKMMKLFPKDISKTLDPIAVSEMSFCKKNHKILTTKLDVLTISSEILYLPFGQQTNCNPKYRSPSAHVERGANE